MRTKQRENNKVIRDFGVNEDELYFNSPKIENSLRKREEKDDFSFIEKGSMVVYD